MLHDNNAVDETSQFSIDARRSVYVSPFADIQKRQRQHFCWLFTGK